MTRTLPPRCGLRGWASAWAVLERVKVERRRDLLADLARRSGTEGAGLKFVAQMLCFGAGEGPWPTPAKTLSPFEIERVQERARELLEPFADGVRLPRIRWR